MSSLTKLQKRNISFIRIKNGVYNKRNILSMYRHADICILHINKIPSNITNGHGLHVSTRNSVEAKSFCKYKDPDAFAQACEVFENLSK